MHFLEKKETGSIATGEKVVPVQTGAIFAGLRVIFLILAPRVNAGTTGVKKTEGNSGDPRDTEAHWPPSHYGCYNLSFLYYTEVSDMTFVLNSSVQHQLRRPLNTRTCFLPACGVACFQANSPSIKTQMLEHEQSFITSQEGETKLSQQ